MIENHNSKLKDKIYEVSALICDDVRAEVNNKRTFVGVYPNILTLNMKKVIIKSLKIVVFISFYTKKIPDNFKIFFEHSGKKDVALSTQNIRERISHTEQDGYVSCSRILIGCPILTIEKDTDLVVSIGIDNDEYEIARSTIKLINT